MREVECLGFFSKLWLDGLVCASLGGSSRVPVLWCPIHRHFRTLMSYGIGLFCVLLQSSSFEIVSGHLVWWICRRQVFTKSLSFETSALVCFHVSEPYNKTDFTLELKRVSLVLTRMFRLFQAGFRVTKTCRAFPILDLMSSSVPPVLLIMLLDECGGSCVDPHAPCFPGVYL